MESKSKDAIRFQTQNPCLILANTDLTKVNKKTLSKIKEQSVSLEMFKFSNVDVSLASQLKSAITSVIDFWLVGENDQLSQENFSFLSMFMNKIAQEIKNHFEKLPNTLAYEYDAVAYFTLKKAGENRFHLYTPLCDNWLVGETNKPNYFSALWLFRPKTVSKSFTLYDNDRNKTPAATRGKLILRTTPAQILVPESFPSSGFWDSISDLSASSKDDGDNALDTDSMRSTQEQISIGLSNIGNNVERTNQLLETLTQQITTLINTNMELSQSISKSLSLRADKQSGLVSLKADKETGSGKADKETGSLKAFKVTGSSKADKVTDSVAVLAATVNRFIYINRFISIILFLFVSLFVFSLLRSNRIL